MSVAAAAQAAPSLATLADSQPRLMDAAAMEYFLIEAVQTLRHSSEVADSRAQKIQDEMIEAGLLPPPQVRAKKDAQRDSVGTGTDDGEEGLRARLEAIGLHVGACITERCATHSYRLLCHTCTDTSETMPWPGWFHRHPGHRKICVQGTMDNVLGQASRQPPNKPPSEFSCTYARAHLSKAIRGYTSCKTTRSSPLRASPLGRAEPTRLGARNLYVQRRRKPAHADLN
jgi:hypothetical protein